MKSINNIDFMDYIDNSILAVIDDIPQIDSLSREIFGKDGFSEGKMENC